MPTTATSGRGPKNGKWRPSRGKKRVVWRIALTVSCKARFDSEEEKHLKLTLIFGLNTTSRLELEQALRAMIDRLRNIDLMFCRCMNIPARYCTGYLGDIGAPPDPAPMDFSAWFEAFVGGRWHTFDARHNIPRIGRILIARGRDAADVAISTTFGRTSLKSFVVTTRQAEQEALSSGETPMMASRR